MRKSIFICQYKILILAGIFSCVGSPKEHDFNQRLWFNYPATYWNSQALHLGNGYFGASFFGSTMEEKFILTDAAMWTGGPAQGNWEKGGINPRGMTSLPKIREAIISGRIQEADSLIGQDFFGSSELYGHFTSIGDLNLDFLESGMDTGSYFRSLDLANAIGAVEYKINDTSYEREYFCSYPDEVLVMKFTGSEPESISFDVSMEIIQDSFSVAIQGNQYRLSGIINGNERPFQVLIHLKNVGGIVEKHDDTLAVRNADSVILYLATATNYALKFPDYLGDDPQSIVNRRIDNAVSQDYATLKKRHVSDYKNLYDRVQLQLPRDLNVEKLPTNERFENLKAGNPDSGYKTLAFNLGKYLIISASRPGSLPANLQGVWNAFEVAPWAGNYQSNINLQEIYWSCGPIDLTECQQPYIDWIADLAHSGREVARRLYGTNGWVSHTTGNIWGHAAPWGNHPWGMFPQGASWHCQHVWDQYLFTQDLDYLKQRGYPLMKEASIFWLENLIPFAGYLICAPTVSAEHGALRTPEGLNPAFHDFRSEKYNYSLPGAYQDIQMIWELFTNTAAAARLLDEHTFADSLISVREQLLPLKIGQYGQLQEWYQDIDNPETHHRHIAHLYAVQPGTMIHPISTPKWAEAAKKSLNMRGDGRYLDQELASGGNWARAHRMWAWTRLMDGDRANKILTDILTEQGFENGLTYQHASYGWGREDFLKEGDLYLHFQMDASASIPGCIAEMLVQSHMGEIHLLPALPEEFHTGEISGLKTRGGYTIDMKWAEGELIEATLAKPKGSDISPVRLKDQLVDLSIVNHIKIIDR